MLNNICLIILAGLIIVTIGHASGPDDQTMAWVEYCEMHALYIETRGKYGWPDYKGTYEEECK